ncbi:MAG: anthranilate synthase component I family protein [Hamadaea sp.]|uniref:chorismate-binding protein n=1 Tax=Hamadaea sp. TaxID=2024425 RepID=UPI001848ADBB|nr:chorismate-binding protein [Hamadaea sp.]NUR74011.1 anthranilate synthase component I family protein [Hamadaea sp.]NUT21190.1 anthranilate synthase component I family protein [Hamadaea sp.]
MRGLTPATGAPVVPAHCRAHARPVARLEWRPGDPLPAGKTAADLVESFLSERGLPVADLAAAGSGVDLPHGPGDICGAALYVSAAAGATLVGVSPGRPTPIPEVPEIVAIVYAHSEYSITQSSDLGLDSAAEFSLGPWIPSWSESDHAEAVAAVRDAIAAGDVYQVNVVGHAAAAYAGDPLPALERLAGLRGAHYAGLISGDGWAIACASPETLVRVRAGIAQTRPIKGTAKATEEGRAMLLASAKERAEHVMIVDLERNDLAQVAQIGSVRVEELFALKHWGDLWQAESTVTARLRPGVGLAELLRAVCPGGSVTGAPKLAALAQIARLEPVGRGASMGALGWVGRDGLDLGLTIRTVAATPAQLHLWAGGGITWGSDPAAEVAEAAAKAAPIKALLGAQPAR